MSSINEYLDKCLAECPKGAEELLLTKLARRLIDRSGLEERITLQDDAGLVGYLIPAYVDEAALAGSPELLEILRRPAPSTESALPLDQFVALVQARAQHRKDEAPESVAAANK